MTFARKSLLSALVALGATLGPVAAAHADDASLKATIAAQDQNLVPSKALTKYGSQKKIGPKQLPAALKVIEAYEPKLNKAADAVAAASPSTAKGRAGQKAWVAGVRQIALEYRDIAAELKALEKGDHAGAGADLQKALKALTKGKKLLAQADKDLGLPSGA
jgi:hypothetical protein